MRLLPLIALAALAGHTAAAQSVILPDDTGRPSAPNARAAERPLGPNARAAQRPAGPNGAIVRKNEARAGTTYHPSCSALGTQRAGPVRRGEPGYGRHLDRDGDGVACGSGVER